MLNYFSSSLLAYLRVYLTPLLCVSLLSCFLSLWVFILSSLYLQSHSPLLSPLTPLPSFWHALFDVLIPPYKAMETLRVSGWWWHMPLVTVTGCMGKCSSGENWDTNVAIPICWLHSVAHKVYTSSLKRMMLSFCCRNRSTILTACCKTMPSWLDCTNFIQFATCWLLRNTDQIFTKWVYVLIAHYNLHLYGTVLKSSHVNENQLSTFCCIQKNKSSH